MNEALWYRLAIALGIGLIVGLERGWTARETEPGQRLAGFRTFTLAALFGGVLGALSADGGLNVLAAGTLAIGALVVAGYAMTSRQHADYGLTTELAMLTTFALGAVAVLGRPAEAAGAAVVMALLLGFKSEFHAAIEKLERHELLATLQLAAIAAVLVPLLPNRQLGPWEAVNPRTIGVLVLLIAGVSYVGYFAVRMLGARLGLLLTALFGGFSSSTAVTVAYARRARAEPAHARLLGAGIALAAATMVPRLAVVIAAVNGSLLALLWPTFVALGLIPLLGLLLALRRTPSDGGASLKLSNPLQLPAALAFGALLAALFILGAGLERTFGTAGVYALAATAGLVDVDAVSISLADAAARGRIAPSAAAGAITLALLVNTAVKAVLATALGGAAMLRTASALLAAALAAAAVTALVTLT